VKQKKDNSDKRLSLELKYCERCGGLWLRPAGSGQVYCASCGREMEELPYPTYDAAAEKEDEFLGGTDELLVFERRDYEAGGEEIR
jgi:Zn-finger nucleic acid-binding protein